MTLSPFFFVRQSMDSLCQVAKQRLRQWTKPDNHDLILNAATDLTRSEPELMLENLLLRQQLIVLKRQVKRPAPGRLNRRGSPFCELTPKRYGRVIFSRPMTCSSAHCSCL